MGKRRSGSSLVIEAKALVADLGGRVFFVERFVPNKKHPGAHRLQYSIIRRGMGLIAKTTSPGKLVRILRDSLDTHERDRRLQGENK